MIKVDKSGVLKQLKHECILEWIALSGGALANSLCGGEFMGIEGPGVGPRTSLGTDQHIGIDPQPPIGSLSLPLLI